MEHHIWLTVLGLTGLLGLAVMMLPAANRLNVPYTVLLAAVGVVLGVVIAIAGDTHGLGPLGNFLEALKNFKITSEMVFFVFLPALVFESALAIDVRRLLDDIGSILLLAIVGLLISTASIGYALHLVSGEGLIACLLLGAIVSATDPVAVVAIFKDLGAPKRLAILVEGESLFNDATAIVAFTILSAMMLGTAEPGLVSGTLDFLVVFVGGIVVGYLAARLGCLLLGWLRGLPLAEATITISLAYLSFIAAEHYLHVSGVMAVVTAALVIGSVGRTTILPRSWHGLTEMWEQIGFWANSIIFVLVGLAVPGILSTMGKREVGLLAVLVAVAFAARFFIVFGLVPLMSGAGLAQKVSAGYKSVMFWGGLRGAVSLALALAVMENHNFDANIRSFVGVLVTGFVLFTLFVNATTVGMVLRLFGLDKLSAADLAIRNRAMAHTLTEIGESIGDTATREDIDPDLARDVIARYDVRAGEAQQELQNLAGLSKDDWIPIGLATLGTQESTGYLKLFADGFVAPPIARLLQARTNDLLDGLKAGGAAGHHEAVERGLSFDWRFRMALSLQRRLGLSGPLAGQIADRFEVLLATRTVLCQQVESGLSQVTSMVGAESGESIERLLRHRLEVTEAALTALKLQYPEYARRLQERHLGRRALRLEQAGYDEMLSQAVISKEVHGNLAGTLESHAVELDRRPRLDLGLKPENLIKKVPFFAELSDESAAQLARLLRSRLAIPGETIIGKGEAGDAMYFITNGAVEVALEPQVAALGTGDFFGELALLSDRPRNADVTAKGFCDLLVLWVKDFRTLLDAHPELRETIQKIAQQRLDPQG